MIAYQATYRSSSSSHKDAAGANSDRSENGWETNTIVCSPGFNGRSLPRGGKGGVREGVVRWAPLTVFHVGGYVGLAGRSPLRIAGVDL